MAKRPEPSWQRHVAALRAEFGRVFPNEVHILTGRISPGSPLEDLAPGYREPRHLPATRLEARTWAWQMLIPLEAVADYGDVECLNVAVAALCKEGLGAVNQMRMRQRYSPRIYWREEPEVYRWSEYDRRGPAVVLWMRFQLEGETLGGNKAEGDAAVVMPWPGVGEA